MSKSHHSRRTRQHGPGKAIRTGPPPTQFFVKELAGEEPPGAAQMKNYTAAAMSFGALKPWDLLNEENLFAVDPAVGGPRWYCSVLGEGGEVYRLVAYEGNEGYRLFDRMRNGLLRDPYDLFAAGHMLYVDYSRGDELSDLDKEVLLASGYTEFPPKTIWPRFRSIRPGHGEWYVNAFEAAVLGDCILSGIIAAGETKFGRSGKFWAEPGLIPLIGAAVDSKTGQHAPRIEMVARPSGKVMHVLAPPEFDPARMQALRADVKRRARVWELAHFPMPIPVGEEWERPRFPTMACGADAGSGKLFPPAMEETSGDGTVGQLLANALLEAIEHEEAIPVTLQVASGAVKTCLAPLASALGIRVVISRELPMIEQARYAMRTVDFGQVLEGLAAEADEEDA